MKTKLLKKVRKRFDINKIEELSYDAPDRYRDCVEKYGLPIYELLDSKYRALGYGIVCPDLSALILHMRSTIRKDYRRGLDKTVKSNKVWWVQK